MQAFVYRQRKPMPQRLQTFKRAERVKPKRPCFEQAVDTLTQTWWTRWPPTQSSEFRVMEHSTILSIGHYMSCPKSAWFMLTGCENADNAPLPVEGRLPHDRVDSGETTMLCDVA